MTELSALYHDTKRQEIAMERDAPVKTMFNKGC